MLRRKKRQSESRPSSGSAARSPGGKYPTSMALGWDCVFSPAADAQQDKRSFRNRFRITTQTQHKLATKITRMYLERLHRPVQLVHVLLLRENLQLYLGTKMLRIFVSIPIAHRHRRRHRCRQDATQRKRNRESVRRVRDMDRWTGEGDGHLERRSTTKHHKRPVTAKQAQNSAPLLTAKL